MFMTNSGNQPTGPADASKATEDFWDKKANSSNSDDDRAVGEDDPWVNRCIERAQRSILPPAIRATAEALQRSPTRVLDLGCGVGRWTSELSTHFSQYCGVDISESMLHIARRKYPEHQFSKLNNMILDFDDGAFDFVISIAVLHHNSYDNQLKLLAEAHRVLQPRGELLLLESVGRPVSEKAAIFYPRPSDEWIAAVEKHGFKLVQKSGTAYYLICDILSWVLGSRRWQRSPFGRACLWVDSMTTPLISPRLPERFHVRALMRFQKI